VDLRQKVDLICLDKLEPELLAIHCNDCVMRIIQQI